MLTPLTCSAMFSPAQCDEIIRYAKAGGVQEAGLVKGRQNDKIRTARIAWLDEDGDAGWVFSQVMATVSAANRSHFKFALTEFAEKVQIAVYDAADGSHFDWHSDIGAGHCAEKRKLTLVAQLSDPLTYEGGRLEMNSTGRVETAAVCWGDATLFPSFTPHRVTPVASGTRCSLTTWVHGPAFL
ncbi:PKHD-type hydroxylase [Tritonibacter horizontis]|uniref:PKHD-type hydroxylase n=2 Tax=Tritonibacter horizontis TaxID=1768241 RepID=A0A132BYA4_9RHOB|nr:PKHD-type hydroxylase [Tritonibacter horizontis]